MVLRVNDKYALSSLLPPPRFVFFTVNFNAP